MALTDFLLDDQLKFRQEGHQFVVVKVVKTEGSVPREIGATMLVLADGRIIGTIGGGAVEAESIRQAADVLTHGTGPSIFEYTLGPEYGMKCGGKMSLYLEPSPVTETVCIFGGGHVAKPLAHLTTLVGFRTIVVDDRSEFALRDRFPHAEQVLCKPYLEAARDLPLSLPYYVALVTKDAEIDAQLLEYYLDREVTYLGMIGSQTKRESIRARLRKTGKDALLDRVHCPIGLSIDAETPEEIAVSIVAEMIAVRRTRGSSVTTNGQAAAVERRHVGPRT